MDIIKQILLENQEYIKSLSLMKRDVDVPEVNNMIVFTGIRRSGKTSLLYLEAQKHPIENVLFLDFEDERLLFLSALANYDVIIDSYHELFPNQKPVFFFDEVQGLPNWHLFVKRLFAKGYKIFLSGSNANLLSRDISTYVSGRAVEVHVSPFSFREFLNLKKIDFSEKNRLTKKGMLKAAFNEFLVYGGFPEVNQAEDNYKKIMIKTIYNLLFYKDLISKHNRNEILMKLIIQKVFENIGKGFSLSNVANKINPLFSTNRQTVTEYFHLLHQPYLITSISQYRTSVLKREGEKKAYLTDNSFITHLTVLSDFGKLLENLVFNTLYHPERAIYYYKTSNGLEVDFYLPDHSEPMLYQVSYDIEAKQTFNREIKALQKAMVETGVKKSMLITNDHKEELNISGKQILILPCWEWLLEQAGKKQFF